ncbi:MAG: hypothetical protein CL607_10535 [Anaerolineaceae bacterium]|nr:hypothetical protein [Anaerolineaceae bacterium]
MYSIEWLIPSKVFYVKMWDSLTLDELIACNEIVRDKYLDAVDDKIHMVAEFKDVESFPRNLRDIKYATSIYTNHENMGWAVLIGFKHPLVKFLASVLTQMANMNMKTVADKTEALDVLRRIDLSLPSQA